MDLLPLKAMGSFQASSNQRQAAANKTCIECRRKHLKCSGDNPCSRCVRSMSNCIYVASRRGCRSDRRDAKRVGGAERTEQQQNSAPVDCENTDIRHQSKSASPDTTIDIAELDPGLLMGIQTYSLTERMPCSQDYSDHYLSSFYYSSFASHPFILPQKFLPLIKDEDGMRTIATAMRWIGSLHIQTDPAVRDALYRDTENRINNDRTPRDGYLVQAMMLFVMALDGCSQLSRAREVLADAEKLAVEIGLHTETYASLHSRGSPILEESWKRTWWYLYILDGMISGVHRVGAFPLYDVFTDVSLPCEEWEYVSGNIPASLSLSDLDERQFSTHDMQFSSFAYCILGARNLGKYMRTAATCSLDHAKIDAIEALLTSWRLHLPAAKRDSLQADGKPDEMIFLAYMITHATSILLHLPYSKLESTSLPAIDACAEQQEQCPSDPVNAHARHVDTSACAISNMVTFRTRLLSHTHFFSCVVTLSSVAHLGRWATLLPGDDSEESMRELIRLNMGALACMSTVWPAASKARDQVASVAGDIYLARKQQWLDPHVWDEILHEDVLS